MLGFHSISEAAISALVKVRAATTVLLGGGPGKYYPHWDDRRQRQLAQRHKELKKVDKRLDEAERKGRETAALLEKERARRWEKKAEQLAALGESLQEEINRLRMERVWLMRLIDDEEAILVILMSSTLH